MSPIRPTKAAVSRLCVKAARLEGAKKHFGVPTLGVTGERLVGVGVTRRDDEFTLDAFSHGEVEAQATPRASSKDDLASLLVTELSLTLRTTSATAKRMMSSSSTRCSGK